MCSCRQGGRSGGQGVRRGRVGQAFEAEKNAAASGQRDARGEEEDLETEGRRRPRGDPDPRSSAPDTGWGQVARRQAGGAPRERGQALPAGSGYAPRHEFPGTVQHQVRYAPNNPRELYSIPTHAQLSTAAGCQTTSRSHHRGDGGSALHTRKPEGAKSNRDLIGATSTSDPPIPRRVAPTIPGMDHHCFKTRRRPRHSGLSRPLLHECDRRHQGTCVLQGENAVAHGPGGDGEVGFAIWNSGATTCSREPPGIAFVQNSLSGRRRGPRGVGGGDSEVRAPQWWAATAWWAGAAGTARTGRRWAQEHPYQADEENYSFELLTIQMCVHADKVLRLGRKVYKKRAKARFRGCLESIRRLGR